MAKLKAKKDSFFKSVKSSSGKSTKAGAPVTLQLKEAKKKLKFGL